MEIRDIAQLSGVSTATVSHVINGTRFVSDEIKNKAQEIIERNGYTLNAHARTLAMQRNHTLGFSRLL